MSSPAGSDHTNSFEDAENGNAGDGVFESVLAEELLAAVTKHAHGAAANAEEEDETVLCVVHDRCDNPDHDDQAGPLIDLGPNAGQEAGVAQPSQNADDEGIGASSTDGQSGQGSLSPNEPESGQVSSTETSLSAGGVTVTQTSPVKSNPVNVPPHPHSLGGYGQRGEETVMAVGVATVDTDTSTLIGGDADVIPGTAEAVTDDDSRAAVSERDVAEVETSSGNCCSECCSRVSPRFWAVWSMGMIIILSTIAGVIYYLVMPLVNTKIRDSLILRPGLKGWQHTQAYIMADVYMFNVTNPDGFTKDGEIPQMRQVGPYSYRLGIEKINLTWNDNGTVSYRERYSYHFDVNRSAGSEDDAIWTANVPFLMVDDYLGPAKFLEEWFLSRKARQVIETHTVKELLLGYKSPVLQEIKTMAKRLPFRMFHLAQDIPETIGALAQENSTISRAFNVYTGADNFTQLNNIYSWNYKRKLPYWTTEQANAIRGTDGTIFKPFLDANSKLSFFYAQLFRTFDLKYQKTRKYRGLHTLRFIIPDSQFSNSTFINDMIPAASTVANRTTPPVSTYDSNSVLKSSMELSNQIPLQNESNVSKDGHRHTGGRSSDKEKDIVDAPYGKDSPGTTVGSINKLGTSSSTPYVPSGIYSIEPCTNAPLYISLPHFLGADPFYLNQISGMEPQEDEHRPIWDIDSVTGVIVSNRRRYQVSAKVDAGKSGETILPLMWIDVQAELDDASIKRLKLASTVRTVLSVLVLLIIGIIATLIIASIALIVCDFTLTENRRYRPLTDGTNQRRSWCPCYN